MLPDNDIPQRYDYTQAGFDPFLSRSLDSHGQTSLGMNVSHASRAVAFDRQQVTGLIGDTMRVGNIHLDGAKGAISLFDENGNEVVRIGELDD